MCCVYSLYAEILSDATCACTLSSHRCSYLYKWSKNPFRQRATSKFFRYPLKSRVTFFSCCMHYVFLQLSVAIACIRPHFTYWNKCCFLVFFKCNSPDSYLHWGCSMDYSTYSTTGCIWPTLLCVSLDEVGPVEMCLHFRHSKAKEAFAVFGLTPKVLINPLTFKLYLAAHAWCIAFKFFTCAFFSAYWALEKPV